MKICIRNLWGTLPQFGTFKNEKNYFKDLYAINLIRSVEVLCSVWCNQV